MTSKEIETNYNKFYSSIGFERLNLFQCIKNNFNPKTTIYLGSSIHITPSFVLQNMTYLDNSEIVDNYFSDVSKVIKFVSSRKKYKQKPSIKFWNNDFNNQDNKIETPNGIAGDNILGVHPNEITAKVWISFNNLKALIEDNGNTINYVKID